jgi:hypothetical protein
VLALPNCPADGGFVSSNHSLQVFGIIFQRLGARHAGEEKVEEEEQEDRKPSSLRGSDSTELDV